MQRLAAAADAAHGGSAPAHDEDDGSMKMQQPAAAAHAAVDMATLTADVAAVAAEVIGQPVDPDQPLMEANTDKHHPQTDASFHSRSMQT